MGAMFFGLRQREIITRKTGVPKLGKEWRYSAPKNSAILYLRIVPKFIRDKNPLLTLIQNLLQMSTIRYCVREYNL